MPYESGKVRREKRQGKIEKSQTNIDPNPSKIDKEIRLRILDFSLDRKVAGIMARITSATTFSAG